MVAIEQCSNTSEERTSRSNINKCPTLENYHCLKTEDGQLRELCTSPIWIEAGKCPIFSVTGKLDARICQSISSGTCPPKVFKSNLNFNYPGCLPSFRAESTTTNIHGKYQTTPNSNFTVSASDEGGSSLVVAIVVPLLVLVIIVTIGIAWWKKKEKIRKWIEDIAQNIRTTELDIESPEAQNCLETTPENSSKEETNRSEEKQELTTVSSEKCKSVEKKKENTTASDYNHEEIQRLMSEEESPKDLPNETQSKIKRKKASKRWKISNWYFPKERKRRKNKNLEEEDKSAENDEETIENQSKLDVENLIKKQERSNEAKSISLQTKDPLPLGKDVLVENNDSG